ncbi:2-C-methyl-D-erythritol 4-phosphate cytidylyltransferase [Corynebacterium cystitidis DSM 20524]|uniref:2-C-methyl-D-erythritol 4-phosphate cytidylyltransferase n=2 Tax=Corynebacterium cystitidis TaxID=35757 RepID=A0A1H9W8D2_9CORY|nr:2-C-methyl-D-erythritol 4-phosphate cytidylyltransferase [Corynebacterium cystitidis DSM 20524]SES30105.1 2-C-methyl-D-erythritol 4-phosphate cytidylyltransferase [Corynebacterium cystitidis DSM 20524]SNV63938.1 2-C-methyl-D-erythritol 4-phosphate cytidylyltransferase [Corynebacterium cystitidis]
MPVMPAPAPVTATPRRVIALIAAAGRGTRLGAEIPKAFVPLRGRTLVERSVTAMETAEIVDEIIVLVSPDMEDHARRTLETHPNIRFVHGGGERADSIWAGVQAIKDTNAVVLIHDAARALTPPGMIARVARTVLAGADAVIPVVPVADTIKQVAGQRVVGTPDRASLRAVQTPQGFDLALLRRANEQYFTTTDPGFVATDDASLMEWYGVDVTCVNGDPMAFKITTPIDLTLATTITNEAEPTVFEVPGNHRPASADQPPGRPPENVAD